MVSLEQQLSRLDLNLLVSLSVLLKEKNVTKAAQALYLSQPAMSRTLGRLRTLFDDPLFYRESVGLVPTQKALELEEPLDAMLRSVQSLIVQTAFDPKTCEQSFTLSLPPLMSQWLSVPLAKAFITQAPRASLLEYPISKDPGQQLIERKVDFSIHITQPNDHEELPSTIIGHTYPVFYTAVSHPLAQQSMVTLEDCLAYRFVDLTLDIRSGFSVQNPIDDYLSKVGYRRDVAFRSGQLMTLVEVMQETTCVLASSHQLSQLECVANKLVPVFAIDDVEAMRITLYLIEHKRTASSVAHQWLKQLIIETTKSSSNVCT
ncbi:LysR family transcriptional regulator [Vibrio sp. 10N.261.51.F12]|uniref:LysR family transcriptional regulator n=1 Tax=Vibrio sp. 10N.261.51.F12 TaxID=3229679 RepID=UPI003553EBEB